MKESIAQAFILNLILFFFGILVLLLFGSINYSKAYKVKNRIITIIEKHGGFTPGSDAEQEIEENLKKAGYPTTVNHDSCKNRVRDDEAGGDLVYPDPSAAGTARVYHYCIIEHKGSIDGSKYYQVITFMEFEIPIFRGFLEFPVRGETKIIYDNLKDS